MYVSSDYFLINYYSIHLMLGRPHMHTCNNQGSKNNFSFWETIWWKSLYYVIVSSSKDFYWDIVLELNICNLGMAEERVSDPVECGRFYVALHFPGSRNLRYELCFNNSVANHWTVILIPMYLKSKQVLHLSRWVQRRRQHAGITLSSRIPQSMHR